MTLPKIDIDRFLNLSNIPTFIQPWLDRFFEDVKVELLLLGEKPLHIDEVSVKWRVAKANFNPDKTQAFLERCYKRGIIAKRMVKKTFSSDNPHSRREKHYHYTLFGMFLSRFSGITYRLSWSDPESPPNPSNPPELLS